MMDWLKRNPLLGVLAAVCILLIAVIGVEAGFGATLRDAMRPASGKKTDRATRWDDRESRLVLSLKAFSGCCALVRPGRICRRDFLPTRPVIAASSSGWRMA